MKEKIRGILWNFVAGEVTDSEAVQQVLDLFAVSGRSEQLVCPDCAEGRDPFEPEWKCPECRRKDDAN